MWGGSGGGRLRTGLAKGSDEADGARVEVPREEFGRERHDDGVQRAHEHAFRRFRRGCNDSSVPGEIKVGRGQRGVPMRATATALPMRLSENQIAN